MSDKECLPEEIIPSKTKVSFALGVMANNLLNGFAFANITFYYVEKLGADATSIGIAWLLFAVWNTANDPIASYLIDNTRTKIGRRIPYIRYGSVFYGLAFIFCWFPIVPLESDFLLFLNFLLALFLLDTMFTLVGCCFFSLPNEIALTAKGRAELSIWTAAFSFISVALGFILPIAFLTGQEGVHPWFLPSMVIIGVVCPIILFVTSFNIKENMFAQLQPHEGFIEGLRLTLKNKAFWTFMIPAFCIALLLPILQIGLLYYIDYVIAGQSIIFLLMTIIAGVIIGVYFNLKNIPKWGPKKIMIFNLTLLSVGFFLLFIMGYNAYLAVLPGFLLGVGLSGGLVANPVVFGDIIDNDELITGKRREAIYGGVNAIVTKPAISIANWMFLLVIVGFGFVAPVLKGGAAVKQPQPDIAILGIMIAFCLIPAILLGLSALSMRLYPLDGPKWEEKKKYLMELHAKKEKEYIQTLAEEGKI